MDQHLVVATQTCIVAKMYPYHVAWLKQHHLSPPIHTINSVLAFHFNCFFIIKWGKGFKTINHLERTKMCC
jgi:hypothetical protein